MASVPPSAPMYPDAPDFPEHLSTNSQDDLDEIAIQDNDGQIHQTIKFSSHVGTQTDSGATAATQAEQKRVFSGVPRAPRLSFPVWGMPLMVAALMIVVCAHSVGWGRWTGFDRTKTPPMFASGSAPPLFPKSSPMWKGAPYDSVYTPIWRGLLTVFGALLLVHTVVISVSARAVIARGAMLPMDMDHSVEPAVCGYLRNLGNVAGVASSIFFMVAGAISAKFKTHTGLLATALILLLLWAVAYTIFVAMINMETKADVVNVCMMGAMCSFMFISGICTMTLYGLDFFGAAVVSAYIYVTCACLLFCGVAWSNRRENILLVTEFGNF